MENPPSPLYLGIASAIAELIGAGQLGALQRVPSVRRLAQQHRVSINTAVMSLRVLEDRGLIVARPRSGYFVAPPRATPPVPAATTPSRIARRVNTQSMLERLTGGTPLESDDLFGPGIPDPSLFPVKALRASLQRVVRRMPESLHTYPQRIAGSEALRGQIAAHYARVGTRLDADRMIVTNGCTEALALAVRAVSAPGDTLAVESPTYFGFLQMAESLGVKVLEIPTHPVTGLSLEALRELLSSRAGRQVRACAAIPSFSNPTGSIMSPARKQELVQLCRDADIALIEDDVYGDLHHTGARPLPCKSFDRDGRVMLCSSFSKSLAPAARIGFVESGRYADTVLALKHKASSATAPLQQEMIADYLQRGRYERHLRRLNVRFAAQLRALSRCVQESFPPGTRLTQPQGGFVLWVALPGRVDTSALHAAALRIGVDYRPGALFSASGRYRNCLRLSAGYPLGASGEAALRRLGALFASRANTSD